MLSDDIAVLSDVDKIERMETVFLADVWLRFFWVGVSNDGVKPKYKAVNTSAKKNRPINPAATANAF